MPTYLYVCGTCGSRREVRHGISESRPACEACGAALERVFTPPQLNLRNCSSPTAAKYARMSAAEEVAHVQAELESVRLSKRSRGGSSG